MKRFKRKGTITDHKVAYYKQLTSIYQYIYYEVLNRKGKYK